MSIRPVRAAFGGLAGNDDGAHARARTPALVRLISAGPELPTGLLYRKAWALLGYLAAEPERRHSRLALAMLFWPDLSESAALTNLRQVLCNLKPFCAEVLGADVLHVERGAVFLQRNGRALFDIDLRSHTPTQVQWMFNEQCCFLAGMDEVAGVDFRTWLESTRHALEGELEGIAEHHCDALLADAQWKAALPLARTLLQRDAWNEGHARRVMRAYAGHGMRAAAINAYTQIQQLLRNDLGVATQLETRQLLAQIHGGIDMPQSDAGIMAALMATARRGDVRGMSAA